MITVRKVSCFRWKPAGAARAEGFNGRGGVQQKVGPGRLYLDDGGRSPRSDYAGDPVDVPYGHRVSWTLVAPGDPYNCSVYEFRIEAVDR